LNILLNVIKEDYMAYQNLAVSAMYIEMARAFSNEGIQFTKSQNLYTVDDIPHIVGLNIKFARIAGAIIFSISSLEAYVNLIIYDILYERFQIDKFSTLNNYNKILKNIDSFKQKYSTEDRRENLFKKEVLTKKINKLYKCFDLELLSETPQKKYQILWQNLEKLQSIRNELIHPKPSFIKSDEFTEFFNQKESELQNKLIAPIIIRYKLFEGTPLYQPNIADNAILDSIIFKYKGDAIKEHLLLTSTEYNYKNVKEWGTRWIY